MAMMAVFLPENSEVMSSDWTTALNKVSVLLEGGMPGGHRGQAEKAKMILLEGQMPSYSSRKRDLLSMLSTPEKARYKWMLIEPKKEKPISLEDMPDFRKDGGYINIMNLLALADEGDIDYWTHWYDSAHRQVKDLADEFGLDYKVVAAVVAALSPGNKWKANLNAASALLSGQTTGISAYPKSLAKAIRILETGDPRLATGPKVSVFYKSLVDPVGTRHNVVLDGHAINIWRGEKLALKGLRNPTVEEKERMKADYRRAAADSGLTPQGVQALTWFLWKSTVKDLGTREAIDTTAL
jgi:hypothetical protein